MEPDELCYESQELILYTSSNPAHDNTPSDTQAAMQYANHLQWRPDFHLHSKHHHMEHAMEPENH